MSHDPGQSAASTLKGLKFKIWKSIVARCVQKELVFVTVTQHLTPHNQFTTDAQREGERLLWVSICSSLCDIHAKNSLDTERHTRQTLDAVLFCQSLRSYNNVIGTDPGNQQKPAPVWTLTTWSA